MRTVHETEALRPSDPVPKSMQGGPAKSTNRLKIIIKTPTSHVTGQDDSVDEGSTGGDDVVADNFTQLTEAQGFTPDELKMDLKYLHGLCRMQLKWTTQEHEKLEREIEHWDQVYKKEWAEVEVLLSQVMDSELSWHRRRAEVLAGRADVMVRPEAIAQMETRGEGDTVAEEAGESAN
jgi:hypothetical protein